MSCQVAQNCARKVQASTVFLTTQGGAARFLADVFFLLMESPEHVVLAGSWVDSPHLPAVLSVAADETSSSPREDNGLEVKDTCGEDVSGERLLTEDRLGLKVEAGSTEGEERPPRTSRQRKRRGRRDR